MKNRIFWFMLVFIMGYVPVCRTETVPTRTEEKVLSEEWLGEYLLGKKIGYSYSKIWQEGDESLYHVKTISSIPSFKLVINGEIEAEKDGTLKSLAIQSEFGGTEIECRGEVRDGVLRTDFTSAGNSTKKEFPLEKPLMAPEMLGLLLTSKNPEAGTTFEYPTFFPITGSMESIKVEVKGWESKDRDGRPTDALRVEIRYVGQVLTSWFAKDGSTIEVLGDVAGMRSIRESKETTEDFGDFDRISQSELISETSLESNVELPDDRFISRLKVRLDAVPEDIQIPSDNRQKVVKTEGGSLEVEVGFPGDDKRIEVAADTWLESTNFVQCDNPDIIKAALEIVKDATDTRDRVDKLVKWMQREMKQDLRVSLPSAVEILQSRRGDCNEFAVLFAALARASKIPTKICAGIVHVRGMFAYHAWNEVYIPGENPYWLTVDSVFPQVPADATHIKFAEGDIDTHVSIAGLVGKLKINVLEFDSEKK